MSWTDCTVLTMEMADEMALKDNGNRSDGLQKQNVAKERLRAEEEGTNQQKVHAEATDRRTREGYSSRTGSL